jgi:hypothetical protein
MLRRALNESMRRVESLSDEGLVQVDRRIVVKLLVTFFEKGQSQEVLSLMARILAFTGQSFHPSCFSIRCSLCRSARCMILAHWFLFG